MKTNIFFMREKQPDIKPAHINDKNYTIKSK